MSSKTNVKPEPVTRDGGRPRCPHCGEIENKTINQREKRFECVACGKIFTVK